MRPTHLVHLTTHLIKSPGALALMQLPIFYDQPAVIVHSIFFTSSPKSNSLPPPPTKKSCRESASYACAYALSESTVTF